MRATKEALRHCHPLLLSVYLPLFLYGHNFDELALADIVVPTLCLVAGSTVAWSALYLLLGRHLGRSALSASITFVAFFTYGPLFPRLKEVSFRVGPIPVGPNKLAGGLALLAAAAAVILVRRLDSPRAATVSRMATTCCVVLIGVATAGLVRPAVSYARGSGLSVPRQQTADGTRQQISTRPDIYHIVLDRYGNERVLGEYMGFDNREFLNELRGRGFHVADEAYANYIRTTHSLASTLNMVYLDPLTERHGRLSVQSKDLRLMYHDFDAWRRLKRAGYRFAFLGEPSHGDNPHADRNISMQCLGSLGNLLYRNSLLYPVGTVLARSVGRLSLFDERRAAYERIRFKFEALSGIARQADGPPRFVLAHFLLPHPPFVFEPDGAFVSEAQAQARTREEGYRRQVLFANNKTLELLDAVAASGRPPAVVIIQGDEGPYPTRYSTDVRAFQWDQATPDEILQKLGILLALKQDPAEARDLARAEAPRRPQASVPRGLHDTGQPLPAGVRSLLRRRPGNAPRQASSPSLPEVQIRFHRRHAHCARGCR